MPGTTYIDYFEKASSGADEDTLVGQNLYKFFAIDEEGLALTDMPFNGQVDAGNVMGQSYPNIDPGNLPQNVINHQGLLVNGVPIFGMLGKAAHTINNQKQTITNFTTSEATKPFYNVAEKIGSLKPKVSHAAMIRDLALNYRTGGFVTASMLSSGRKTHTPDWSLNTPTFPTHNTTASKFNVFEHFKIGADGSEGAITTMESLQCRMTQGNPATTIGDVGHIKSISPWDPIFSGFVITFRDPDEYLWENSILGTKFSVLWKMSKSEAESGNSHWFEFDTVGASAICNGLTSVKRKGNVVLWTAVITCSNITCVMQDYVNDSFYT